MAKHNQNQLSSDDTEAERQEKLAAAQREKEEADAAAAEEKRKADEKAADAAAKEASRKPTAAHPDVSAGSEPHNPKGSDTPVAGRPVELVKEGQSGHRVGPTKYTRQQLADIVKGGGSVLHKGVLIRDAAHLPPESDFVGTEAEASALADKLEAQRDEIDAQIARLKKK